MSSTTFSITVNGNLHTVDTSSDKLITPYTTLADFLRLHSKHKDTKVACGEGGCGACTVALTYADAATGAVETRPVNACLALLFSLDGMSVTTSEGIGNQVSGYHTIQTTLAAKNGTQCGYCSTGMSMLLYSYLQDNATPTALELEKILDGNLCRCTGYRPILDTYKSFAAPASGTVGGAAPPEDGSCRATNCCKKRGGPEVDLEDIARLAPPAPAKTRPSKKQCHVKTAQIHKTETNATGALIWHDVEDLTKLSYYMTHYAGMKVMLTVGGTSLGVYRSYKYDVFLNIAGISEFNTVTTSPSTGITIGTAVTVHDTINALTSVTAPSHPHQIAHFAQAVRHLKRVAGYAIRCRASIGGNLALTHQHQAADDFFTSDVCITMMGLGATVNLYNAATKATSSVSMTDFFTTSLTGLALQSITIPWGKADEVFMSYKIAIRQVMDHALVNAAMRVTLVTNPTTHAVTIGADPTIAIGGVMAKPTRVTATEASLVGMNVTDVATLKTVATALTTALTANVAPGSGRAAYRVQTAANYLYKFLLFLQPVPSSSLVKAEQDWMTRPVTTAAQSYATPEQFEEPISQAIPKVDGLLQTSGEAVYTDDIPDPQNCAYIALVQSQQSNATISAIDATVCADVYGFLKYYDSTTFTGVNMYGNLGNSGPLLQSGKSDFCGQGVGIVVAQTEQVARICAAMIEATITYSNIGTPVVDITTALAQPDPFLGEPITYTRPANQTVNWPTVFAGCHKTWTGTREIGAEAHFALERHAVLVQPTEGQLICDVASQSVSVVHKSICTVLRLPQSDVVVRTRRCGGAFGAKNTVPTYTAPLAAFVAKELNIPVRFNLLFSQPFQMQGNRPRYRMDYKLGTDQHSKIRACKLDLYLMCGMSSAGCGGEANLVARSIDNCYDIPYFTCTAKMVKANLPSTCSCRGPGWIQAIMFMEMLIEESATKLGIPSNVLRASQFYKKGDTTLGGMVLRESNVSNMYAKLLTDSNYAARVTALTTFNATNKFVKRGIACMPARFAVHWGPNFNATVACYPDGAICITQGGCEIGQGLTTKVSQACAMKFGYTETEMLKYIKVLPTNTSTVSGSTNITGGSIGSELSVLAVLHACDDLLVKVGPFMSSSVTFRAACAPADAAGVNLTSSANSNTPKTSAGASSRYNSWGVACSEVEIDALTGQFEVKRTDITFDCGVSMNPAIDIGQVEGAFMMGLGWFTSEFATYDPTTGAMKEPGSWLYKPTSAYEVPEVFNVSLCENSQNTVGVLSSKAVGEPPLALAGSVFFALNNAINAARLENGLTGDFQAQETPLTVPDIQEACGAAISNYTLS